MRPSHQWYGVIPGWLLFYAPIVMALVLFGLRVAYLSRLMLQGQPTARWDNIPARLRAVLVFVLGQLRLLRGDFWPGLMHATIFWGFIILTLGTIEFFGKGVTKSFSLLGLERTPAYVIVQDFFDLAVLGAVAYAAFQHDPQRVPELRRPVQRHPPRRAAGRADPCGAAPRRPRAGGTGHVPRPVLPRPLQRRVRSAAAGGRLRLPARAGGDAPAQEQGASAAVAAGDACGWRTTRGGG